MSELLTLFNLYNISYSVAANRDDHVLEHNSSPQAVNASISPFSICSSVQKPNDVNKKNVKDTENNPNSDGWLNLAGSTDSKNGGQLKRIAIQKQKTNVETHQDTKQNSFDEDFYKNFDSKRFSVDDAIKLFDRLGFFVDSHDAETRAKEIGSIASNFSERFSSEDIVNLFEGLALSINSTDPNPEFSRIDLVKTAQKINEFAREFPKTTKSETIVDFFKCYNLESLDSGVGLSTKEKGEVLGHLASMMEDKKSSIKPNFLDLSWINYRGETEKTPDKVTNLKNLFGIAMQFNDKQRLEEGYIKDCFLLLNSPEILGEDFKKNSLEKAKIISDAMSKIDPKLGGSSIGFFLAHKDQKKFTGDTDSLIEKTNNLQTLIENLNLKLPARSISHILRDDRVSEIIQNSQDQKELGTKLREYLLSQTGGAWGNEKDTQKVLENVLQLNSPYEKANPIDTAILITAFKKKFSGEIKVEPNNLKQLLTIAQGVSESQDGKELAESTNKTIHAFKDILSFKPISRGLSNAKTNLGLNSLSTALKYLKENDLLANIPDTDERIKQTRAIYDQMSSIDTFGNKYKAFNLLSSLEAFKSNKNVTEVATEINKFIEDFQKDFKITESSQLFKALEDLQKITKREEIKTTQELKKYIQDYSKPLKSLGLSINQALNLNDQSKDFNILQGLSASNRGEATKKILSTFNFYAMDNDYLFFSKKDKNASKVWGIEDLEIFFNGLSNNKKIVGDSFDISDIASKILNHVKDYNTLSAMTTVHSNDNLSAETVNDYHEQLEKNFITFDRELFLSHRIPHEYALEHKSMDAFKIVDNYNQEQVIRILERELNLTTEEASKTMDDMKKSLGLGNFTYASAEAYADSLIQLKKIQENPNHQFDSPIVLMMLPEYKKDRAFVPLTVAIRNLKEAGLTVFISENDKDTEIPRIAKAISMNDNELIRPISVLFNSGHGSGDSVHLNERDGQWHSHLTRDENFLDVSDLSIIQETLQYLEPNKSSWILGSCLAFKDNMGIGSTISNTVPKNILIQGPRVPTKIYGGFEFDSNGLPIFSFDNLALKNGKN